MRHCVRLSSRTTVSKIRISPSFLLLSDSTTSTAKSLVLFWLFTSSDTRPPPVSLHSLIAFFWLCVPHFTLPQHLPLFLWNYHPAPAWIISTTFSFFPELLLSQLQTAWPVLLPALSEICYFCRHFTLSAIGLSSHFFLVFLPSWLPAVIIFLILLFFSSSKNNSFTLSDSSHLHCHIQ